MLFPVRVLVCVVGVSVCLLCCCTAEKVPPQFELDLDLPPRQRWVKIYKSLFNDPDFDMSLFKSVILSMKQKVADKKCNEQCTKRLEAAYKQRFPEYYEELAGIYDVLPDWNFTMAEFVAMQSEYEFTLLFLDPSARAKVLADELHLVPGAPGCTSILTCNKDHQILHGRNLDWGADGRVYAAILFTLNFTRNKQLIFQTHQIPGHLGVVSGVRPKSYSMTLNARVAYEVSPTIDQYVDAVETIPMQPIMTGYRYYFENFKNYDDLIQNITTTPYCAGRYSIIASIDGRGGRYQFNFSSNYAEHSVIITKEELDCSDNSWYVAQCNSDIGFDTPLDPRRQLVMEALDDEGRVNGTTVHGVYRAMTIPMVLNSQTIHTSVMSPASGDIVTIAHDI